MFAKSGFYGNTQGATFIPATIILDAQWLLSGFSVQIASQWIPREAHLRVNLLSRFVDRTTGPWFRRFSPSWIANGVRIPLTVLRLTTMLRFQDLILCSCLRAVAPSMPFPWIGEAKIIGFVLLFPWSWTWLTACESAAQLVLSSSMNSRLGSYGLCRHLFLPNLPVLLWTLFIYQWGLIWLFASQIRRCFTEKSHLFSLVVRNLLCWLCALISGQERQFLIHDMFLYLACLQLVFFAVVTGLCDLEAAYAYMAVFFWYIGGYSVVSRSCTAVRLL